MRLTSKFWVLLILLATLLSSPTATLAETGSEAVRRVGSLMEQERWAEALQLARKAPISEATRATLVGMVAMRTGAYRQAIQSFQTAVEQGADHSAIPIYMAWSHHALGQKDEAQNLLESAAEGSRKHGLYWLLRARLARDAGQPEQAYRALVTGLRVSPTDPDLRREQGFLLVEFGALSQARPYLVPLFASGTTAERLWSDGTRLLKALNDRKQYDEALFYTEILRVRLPTHGTRIDLLAAHLHARAGRPVAAARFFERASLRGEELHAFEAADQYRLAQRTDDALRWNARVADEARRLRQRFLILTEDSRWSRAAVVGRRVEQSAGFDTPMLRYRYGVALLLGAGDVTAAREQAELLGDGAEAERLQRLIETCGPFPTRCQ